MKLDEKNNHTVGTFPKIQ